MVLLQLLLFALTIRGGSGADPVWDMPAMAETATVNENSLAGTPVYTLTATDADTDPITYAITSQTPGNPTFVLIGDQLQAPLGLDADGAATSFALEFTADDGTGGVVTSPILTVTVNDLPDMNPVYGQASYAATVKQGVANGHAVVTVSATPDVTGGTITYTLASGNTGPTFGLDMTTGAITVSDTTMLATPSYTLVITASDGTNSDNVNVVVTIDANPSFDTPSGADSASVVENIAAGMSVYQVAATDPEGDSIIFSIVSQVPAMPVFTITAMGELQTPAGLDADTAASYAITFGATHGMGGLTPVNSALLTVTITDLADENPVFSPASYSFTISDSVANTFAVGTISATADVLGATITYTITGGNTGTTFIIDNMSGALTVSDATQLASNPSYTLMVTASDGTNMDTVNVGITVSSNALPSWSAPNGPATASVVENIAVGMSVYQVAATDSNGDTITYGIASQTPTTPVFTLTMMAELQTPAGLDADTVASYMLTFNASDGIGTVISDVLTVTITDIADENPVFDAASYSFTIMDGASNGDTVGTVSATPDLSGASVNYSISSGNTPNTFAIGMTSGVITVDDATMVDSATTPSYTLTILAADGPRTNTVSVDITVNDAKSLRASTFFLVGMSFIVCLLR